MLQGLPFKVCLAISVIAHSALIYPWAAGYRDEPAPDFRKVDIAYLREPALEVIRKTAEPVMEPAKIERRETGNDDTGNAKGMAGGQDSEKFEITVRGSCAELKESPKDIRVTFVDKETIERYSLEVRKKIKEILEDSKRGLLCEGEVLVKFIVGSNGALKEASLVKGISKSSSYLEDFALESVKAASPFPPFYEGLKREELLFRLPIRFTLKKP